MGLPTGNRNDPIFSLAEHLFISYPALPVTLSWLNLGWDSYEVSKHEKGPLSYDSSVVKCWSYSAATAALFPGPPSTASVIASTTLLPQVLTVATEVSVWDTCGWLLPALKCMVSTACTHPVEFGNPQLGCHALCSLHQAGGIMAKLAHSWGWIIWRTG